MSGEEPVAVVAGVGPGNGAALARRFSYVGYALALIARQKANFAALENELDNARGFECDLGDDASVKSTFTRIRNELGEVDVLLYNAGSGVFADVEHITPEQFERAWRVNAYGALLCSPRGDPGHESEGRRRDYLHRGHGIPPGKYTDGRVRTGQSGSTEPRRIHGSQALARRHSRRADHRRRGGGPASNPRGDARQAG
jgi:NAD(P)-dependent dehydrogenase (short-subunit alcohol dehydrogenase family)